MRLWFYDLFDIKPGFLHWTDRTACYLLPNNLLSIPTFLFARGGKFPTDARSAHVAQSQSLVCFFTFSGPVVAFLEDLAFLLFKKFSVQAWQVQ